MPFTAFFIDNLYRCLLDAHLAALIALMVCGIWYSWAQAHSRWRWVLISAVLFLVAFAQPVLREERPAVYCDEFFYASTAYNMATQGRVAPFCEQGYPAREARLDYPCPPYPAGWPHLVSLGLRWSACAEADGERPVWNRAVAVNRLLFCLAPLVLFWALHLRYSDWGATLMALTLPAIPALQRLSQSGSAELAALCALLVAFWSWCAWRRGARGWQLAWVAVSLAWVAEMRPEGLGWSVLGLAAVAVVWRRLPSPKKQGQALLALALLACLIWPAMFVLAAHPRASDHHFQALPRENMTMNVNRAHNVLNNAWALADNKIWPLGLTALALVGLGLSTARGRWFWAGAALAMTAFLSWFPFGDYDCVYSADTWRFTYHLILPALALGAEAWAVAEARRSVWVWILVGVCLLGAAHGWVCPNRFLAQTLPMERVWEQGRALQGRLGESPVVTRELRYYQLLRFGCALPATLAPLESVPSQGAVVFRVVATESVENSGQFGQKLGGNVHKSVQKSVDKAENCWQIGEKQSFVQNYAVGSETNDLDQLVWQLISGDLNHNPAVEVYLVRKGL